MTPSLRRFIIAVLQFRRTEEALTNRMDVLVDEDEDGGIIGTYADIREGDGQLFMEAKI